MRCYSKCELCGTDGQALPEKNARVLDNERFSGCA